jgi:hypothetical protein
MTRLLGQWLHSHCSTPSDRPAAGPVSPGWEPLPEDVAEWMGMAPYPADRT